MNRTITSLVLVAGLMAASCGNAEYSSGDLPVDAWEANAGSCESTYISSDRVGSGGGRFALYVTMLTANFQSDACRSAIKTTLLKLGFAQSDVDQLVADQTVDQVIGTSRVLRASTPGGEWDLGFLSTRPQVIEFGITEPES